MTTFKIGDPVRIITPGDGRTGTVCELPTSPMDQGRVRVQWTSNRTWMRTAVLALIVNPVKSVPNDQY